MVVGVRGTLALFDGKEKIKKGMDKQCTQKHSQNK
jgi:hypothetical protein